MKRVSNITVQKKVGTQKRSPNEVGPHGHRSPAGGTSNLNKDKNVVGVEPKRGQ